MEEEEHEVYGGEIPVEGEMEGDMDSHHADVDMSAADDAAVKVLPPYLSLFMSTLNGCSGELIANHDFRSWMR